MVTCFSPVALMNYKSYRKQLKFECNTTHTYGIITVLWIDFTCPHTNARGKHSNHHNTFPGKYNNSTKCIQSQHSRYNILELCSICIYLYICTYTYTVSHGCGKRLDSVHFGPGLVHSNHHGMGMHTRSHHIYTMSL